MSIEHREWRWVLIVAVVALLLSNLPSALAFLWPPEGTAYTGIDSVAPGDLNVYRSYLEQVYQGDFVLRDIFTSEPQRPWIVTPFWLALGLFGSLLHLPTLLVYFLFRVFFGFLLIFLIYRFAAELTDNVRTRKLALLLATFAGGIGAWVAPIASAVYQGTTLEHVWPMDLWVSEGFTFLSLSHSPHFLAGTILILLAGGLMLRSVERLSTRDAVFAGLSMLALYSFHPFHVLSLGLVTVGFLIMILLVRRKEFWGHLGRLALAWAIASPALAYQIWAVVADPFGSGRASQNILYTPPVITTVLSYGFLLLGAVVGAAILWRRRRPREQLFVVWGIAHLAAIYVPIFFNRRVTQGLNIVLALLAAVGIMAWIGHVLSRKKKAFNAVAATFALVIAFAMSPLWVLAQDLSFLLANGRSLPHFFYLSKDYKNAFEWLKKNTTEADVILTAPITGNFVPGLSGRRVVVGHNVETLEYPYRELEAKQFFDSESPDGLRQRIISERGVTYVVKGPWEERLGTLDPNQLPYLTLVYALPTVRIYRVVEI